MVEKAAITVDARDTWWLCGDFGDGSFRDGTGPILGEGAAFAMVNRFPVSVAGGPQPQFRPFTSPKPLAIRPAIALEVHSGAVSHKCLPAPHANRVKRG